MRKKVLCFLLLFLLLAGSASAESGTAARDAGAKAASVSQPEISSFDGLSGKTVSMLTGAPFEELVLSKAPDVGEFTFSTICRICSWP